MSDFEIILHTCNKIEIPPKPSKKAQIITLIPSSEQGTMLTRLTPEVSSIIPDKNGIINSKFIPKGYNNGLHKEIINWNSLKF